MNNTDNRVFTDHGHYFSLIIESSWINEYDRKTNELIRRECTGWSKTHLIITHSCMKSAHEDGDGLQILRFHSNDGKDWRWAANPYAGVYLKKDEWKKVYERINQ